MTRKAAVVCDAWENNAPSRKYLETTYGAFLCGAIVVLQNRDVQGLDLFCLSSRNTVRGFHITHDCLAKVGRKLRAIPR